MAKKKLTKLQAGKIRTSIMIKMKRLFDDKFAYGKDSVVKMSLTKFVETNSLVARMIKD